MTAANTAAANPGEWSLRKRAGVGLLHLAIALLGTVSTGKGVFFPSLVSQFALTHAAAAALLGVSSLVGGLVAFVAGWLMLGRVQAPRVIAAVPLLAGAGYLIASFAHSYGQLMLGYVLMSGILVNQVAVAFLLAQWFSMRRGFALALVYAGTTTGGVLLTPVLSAIVQHWSWRAGYQTLAAALFVLAPLLQWLLKSGEKDGALGSDRKTAAVLPGLTVSEALVTRSFWAILFANFIFGANTGTYFVHFIAMLESVGYRPAQAAWTMSQLFLLAAAAKIVFGHLGDRMDIRGALSLALTLSAAGWFVLYRFDADQTALYVFTVVFGLSYSGPLVLFPLLASAVFGKRSFSLIDAVITVVGLSIGGAVGPVLAGWIFDQTGSYRLLFVVLGISLIAAAGVVQLARRRETTAAAPLSTSQETSNGFA